MTDFAEWFKKELRTRNWDPKAMPLEADLSSRMIRFILSGREIGYEGYMSIARAFEMPPEDVLRAAGLLPPLPAETLLPREFEYLFSHISPERQKEIIRYLRFLIQEQEGNIK